MRSAILVCAFFGTKNEQSFWLIPLAGRVISFPSVEKILPRAILLFVTHTIFLGMIFLQLVL
jgi:hypothetical protein